MKQITLTDFKRAYETENLNLLDVRAKEDYDAAHLPHGINIPLEELTAKLEQLDAEKTYHVICYSGNRSAMACEMLAAQDVDAINILGGMNAWSGETISTH